MYILRIIRNFYISIQLYNLIKMKEAKKLSVFETLCQVDVNEYVKEKNGLSYLAWTFAWQEVKKRYPDATYKIWKDEKNRPYVYDEKLGYMCFTEVTIQGETLEMWLPVMDGANKAQKSESYTYQVKDWNASKAQNKNVFKTKSVEAATMFDINTTIMRCLVKNIGMFGLGHYIYAGESIPPSLIDLDELVEVGINDCENIKDPDSLVKMWHNSKLIQDNEKFKDAYTAAAIKFLDNCGTAQDCTDQWQVFGSSLASNHKYVTAWKAKKSEVSAPRTAPNAETTEVTEEQAIAEAKRCRSRAGVTKVFKKYPQFAKEGTVFYKECHTKIAELNQD